MQWFIDASNVIGSRPDGWWRDREGAVRRFVDEVRAWARAQDGDVTVVLDAGPDDVLGPDVVRAPRRGRNAADDEIVRRVAANDDDDVVVVTSDAELAARVRALGARVEGAGAFRRKLGSRR